MTGLAVIIVATFAIPGAAIGFGIALLRRSSIAGVLADLILGAAGSVTGGMIAVRIFSAMNGVAASNGTWMIWLASAIGAVLAIAIVRSAARAITGIGRKETAI